MDLGTGMVGFYPTSARGLYECKNSINHFAGADPTERVSEGQARLDYPRRFQCPGQARDQRRS
eukprot:404746-Alexandrium_andersonii.AAC.1